MKVINLRGTSDKSCPKCGSWIAHYSNKKRAFLPTVFCQANGCGSFASVGAHVKKYGSSDEAHYIVPFCDAHNKDERIIDIGGTELVSAVKCR